MFILASALLPTRAPGAHVWATPAAARSSLAERLASGCAQLPPATRLQDGVLASLHHAAVATGAAAVLLLAPGHRPPAGSDATGESSDGAALLLQALNGALAGVAGDAAAGALALVPDRMRRLKLQRPWFADARAGAGIMYA
eukprot:241699-Chlamydomonas_euryale.AAC.6